MRYSNAVDIRELMLELDRKRSDSDKALRPTARERAIKATQQIIDAYASALKGESTNEAWLDQNGWFSTYSAFRHYEDSVFWHTYYMLQDKGFRTKIVDKGSIYGDVILIRV